MSPPPASNADESAPSAEEPNQLGAKAAGRGGLAIAGAKIYFMVTGLVQQILLRWILGLDGYGAYSTASSVASITYNPSVQTSIQGVSRVVAGSSDADVPTNFRRTLVYHTVGALSLGAAFLLLAAPLASALGAPHITTTLHILAGIVVVYGLYAPLIGALNGLRRFVSQALFDVLSATLRTIGLVAGGFVALKVVEDQPIVGVEGSVAGFAGASVVVLLAAVRVAGIGRRGRSSLQLGEYLTFVLPIFGGQMLLNVLFQADALLLRRFASEAANAAGLLPRAADPFVGAYRAAQLFCFLPYQLLMSVTFVLFPLLARARAEDNRGEVQQFVQEGVRLAALLSGLMVSLLVALPHGLIALVYGADAAALGGEAMRVLSIGLGFFAILGVMTSALNSLGAERGSLLIITLAVLLVGSLCWFIARGAPLSSTLLFRTALATTLALSTATIAAALLLWRVAGGALHWSSLLRICLAIAGTAAVLHFAFAGHEPGTLSGILATLAGAVCTLPLYAGLLKLFGELGSQDVERVRAVLKKGE